MKSITKEVIDNLLIDSEKLVFLSRSTVYEENNGAIDMATSPRITPTSNHIAVKYHWFRQHIGKGFGISSKKTRRRIFSPKVYKVDYFQNS